MKANITQTEIVKSVRKTWGFSPISRRIESKKSYNRKGRNGNKFCE